MALNHCPEVTAMTGDGIMVSGGGRQGIRLPRNAFGAAPSRLGF